MVEKFITIQELLNRKEAERVEKLRQEEESRKTGEFLELCDLYYGGWNPYDALMGKYDHLESMI